MITIKNYISMIYDDFREYIDQNVNLCMLKTLNYQAGQKPDYSDIHIQQLYLLRYVFSYAFEYKSMFDTLFAREKFKDSIEVASIGCGNMIDYWGLVEALGEIGSGECYIKYRGIDTIDWNYKIEAREKDEVKFTKVNAATIFQKTSTLISNVYIFPKSISEFSNEEFQDICESFRKKEIQRDRIHILISLRSDQGSMDRDMERSEKIISAIKQNGFITEDNATTFIHYKDEDRGIKKIDYKFEYPNEAIELLTSLNTECSTKAMDDGDSHGYDLRTIEHRYFFVEKFYETDFKKVTPRAPMGTRIFDLTQILGTDDIPSTDQLAEMLKNETWT